MDGVIVFVTVVEPLNLARHWARRERTVPTGMSSAVAASA